MTEPVTRPMLGSITPGPWALRESVLAVENQMLRELVDKLADRVHFWADGHSTPRWQDCPTIGCREVIATLASAAPLLEGDGASK